MDARHREGFWLLCRRPTHTGAGVRARSEPGFAYLVLARGTGRKNRETAWSVLAVETHTGIARTRAHAAIKSLIGDGIVSKLKDGKHPKYDLLPWHLIPGTEPRSLLTSYRRTVLDKTINGEKSKSWSNTIAELIDLGWLMNEGDGQYSLAPRPDTDPDWIWLPNELVTGAAAETPPVELARQIQDLMTLRLFVDLYHAQNRRDDGGTSRNVTGERYDRVKVGQQGAYNVWGFNPEGIYMNWVGPFICHRREKLRSEEQKAGRNSAVDFLRRMDHLVELGLIEWVPHLVESDEVDAEIIHAVGIGGSDMLEDRIGDASHEAGQHMLSEGQQVYTEKERSAPRARIAAYGQRGAPGATVVTEDQTDVTRDEQS